MDVSRLHKYVSAKNIMSLQSLKKAYPSYDNIEYVITSSPELFWVATHNENHTEVRAKLDVELCYLYLASTCDGNCGCLHICKNYLLSRKFCPSVCKYGLSHTIMDSHNRRLLPINKHSQWELLLRSSFPRLCTTFTSGAKCDKQFCGYLHLCRDFIHGTCIGKCELATASGKLKADLHNCGNNHNKKVLNNFGLSHLKNDRKILFANILTKKNDIFDDTVATDLETKSFFSANSMSTANEVPANRPILYLDERYQTERNARRRPVYKDKDLIRQKKASMSALLALPLHWPKKFKQGERIPTGSAIYSKIKRSFQTSIAKSVEVLKVEEICNEPFYDKYGRKKMELSKKMTDINEKSLYHGTEHGVVDAICAQNFDWRLCGKNATMFGHGSYFSTSASYSHKYTTADPQLDIRYMFVADVLVGRYTKGDSSMKRPPLIPSSGLELYDSCANDVSNPSIYVVFERDQCYPKYLISYKIRSPTQDGSSSSVYLSYQTFGVSSQTAPARRVSASTAPARQYSAASARQVAASTAPVRQYSAAPVRQPALVSAYNSSPSSIYGYGTSSTSYSTRYGGSNTNAMSASSSVSSSVNTGRNSQYSWDSRSSTSSSPTSRRQSQPTYGGQSSPSLQRSASVQEKKGCVIS